MREHTWALDPSSGDLIVEGLDHEGARAIAGDLLPAPRELICARPLVVAKLPPPAAANRCGLNLRVAAIYHGSVIEGPGRRSVVQLQGCELRCPGFISSYYRLRRS